jgi:hypothetical protein
MNKSKVFPVVMKKSSFKFLLAISILLNAAMYVSAIVHSINKYPDKDPFMIAFLVIVSMLLFSASGMVLFFVITTAPSDMEKEADNDQE